MRALDHLRCVDEHLLRIATTQRARPAEWSGINYGGAPTCRSTSVSCGRACGARPNDDYVEVLSHISISRSPALMRFTHNIAHQSAPAGTALIRNCKRH